MKRNHTSIDGFSPRRKSSTLGEAHRQSFSGTQKRTELHSGDKEGYTLGRQHAERSIVRSDISDSLKDIDDEAVVPRGRRRSRHHRKQPKGGRTKKIIKRTLLALVILGVLVAGYVLLKGILASNNIFKGNIFDIVKNQPLKEDKNGRSNFLIFGTAEDDEGGTHSGGNLTDSIMILSVNQTKQDAFMISLPRDLWVAYEETCTVGNQGKLNAAYFCASDDGEDEAAGAAALQKKAGEILGMDIQYYIHLNFTAVVEAVDAVGGVDVTIESNPKGMGILDRNFDWKCGYRCYYVKYEDGEKVHLDGEHALALARARNAQGGYGLADSNFDREKNQQKIIKALREKAVSVGTLTNVGKVTGLIDALGNNLRTNVETKEIRTLVDLASKITNDKIASLTLVDKEDPLVTTGSYSGQSIVRPVDGLFSYSSIHAYIEKHATSNEVTKEAASIVVLNGSNTPGVAQDEADKLEEKGFLIDVVDNAPEGEYGKVEIYRLTEGSPHTAAKLKEIYKIAQFKTVTPPVAVADTVKFVIVIGAAPTQ